VIRGFEHDLLVGIALRFVETSSGLQLAENVRNSVVADAIATAEISVRVVVERAPTEAAGELRVGGDLIVNARVAKGMLAQAIGVVG
jgi:hypothetical protein